MDPCKSTTSIVSIAGSSLTSHEGFNLVHENQQEKGPYTNAIALLGAPNRNSYTVDRRKRARHPADDPDPILLRLSAMRRSRSRKIDLPGRPPR
ncbi:hypothetical protein E4U19_005553 [Claviceps sp. Clav32 group G5]|nr:hypothetical protein E4U19_005553 [Claviceps sp. Clav32 group G5]